METFFNNENQSYERAAKRVKELRGFYGNLTSYCLVIPFLTALNLLTDAGHLWFFWPMLGWGIGIAAHGINTFGIGKHWEEQKIRELMEEERKNKKSL